MIPVGRGPDNDPHVRISRLADRVYYLEQKVKALEKKLEKEED